MKQKLYKLVNKYYKSVLDFKMKIGYSIINDNSISPAYEGEQEYMKKSIISILMVFVLIASFAACKKLPDDVYFEAPTNEYGEVVTTLPAELEDFINSFDTSDPAQIEQQFEQMLDQEEVKVELEFGDAPIDDSNAEKVEVELGSDGKPDRSDMTKNYEEIMAGDEFTVDMVIRQNMDGQEVNVPMYITRSGENLYSKMSAPYENRGTITFNMLKTEDGKLYCIVPSMRAYVLLTEDEVGDIPLGEYIEEGVGTIEDSSEYIETKLVEVNGKSYECDVYKDGDITTKNYFDKDGLKRIETVDAEGNTTIIEINKVEAKADKSKFKAPVGYVDLTTLLKNAGNGSVPTTKQ